MKIKKLWIPTIVMGAVGGGAKLCDTLFNYAGKDFFLDSSACSFIFVLSLLLVLVIGSIMLIMDRKLEASGRPSKNTGAAFFGFIASVSIVGSGVISLLSIGSDDSAIGSLIVFVLGMLGGVVMLYESCICFTGQNGMKRIPFLALALPAWACGRLIGLFIEYSKVSIHATEMFDIISVALLSMFMFYHAMFFAELNSKKAVGRIILYGCSYVMCALITTADIITKMFVPAGGADNVDVFVVQPTLSRILTCTTDISLCGFAICFIVSMIKNLDIKGDNEDEEDEEIDEDEFFGFISGGNEKNSKKSKDGSLPEPEPFSGSTLRFEDTLTMDRDEIKKSAVEKATGDVVKNVVSEPDIVAEEADVSGTEAEPAAVPTKVGKEEPTDKPGQEFEPAFEVDSTAISDVDEEQTVPAVEEVKEEQDSGEAETESTEKTELSQNENEIIDSNAGTDNVFADENGDVDYDEVFRLLDEMSNNENF